MATQIQPAPLQPAAAPAPVVELRDIRKTYYKPDGSIMVEALRGVDLAIAQGEYLAIMGASGSGKSTMLNILGCLDRPTQGQYLLNGRDVTTMDDEELSAFRGSTIGFIFQAFNLIAELSILENAEVPLFYQGVPKAQRRERAARALAMVGLDDRIDHRPRELSGGQQQRAAIARALVSDPIVLLADEPTGNLDSATGKSILELFDGLHRQGRTIIIITHDDDVAHRTQRIIRLTDGRVSEDRRLS